MRRHRGYGDVPQWAPALPEVRPGGPRLYSDQFQRIFHANTDELGPKKIADTWQPVIDSLSLAPWLQHLISLRGGYLCWGTSAGPLDAANASTGQLFVPTTCKRLVVLWKVKSDVPATIRVDTGIAGPATGVADFRDLRLILRTLYDKPVAQLAHGIGTLPGNNNELWRLAAGQEAEVWATLAPGRAVNLWTTAINTAINANFLWIEIPAFDEELLLK